MTSADPADGVRPDESRRSAGPAGGRRDELARAALAGYVNGPAAATEPTAQALAMSGGCRAIVIVEGISDQIAIEALAERHGRDLHEEGVVVLPIGGAQAIGRFLLRFGPDGDDVRLVGFCDAGEETVFRRGLTLAHLGTPRTRVDMGRLGFSVCVEDLEDELIRAVGTERVEALFESQGDLGSFRTLQKQPQWRGERVEAQMRRFLGSGARRKLRYARLLTMAAPADRTPGPLEAVLARV